MSSKIWYLKNAGLFSWLNQAEIEELGRTTCSIRKPSGQGRRGDAPDLPEM